MMKAALLIASVLVAITTAQVPTFPTQYYLKGVFSIPYFNITEPLEVWFDAVNNRQVITYYDRTNVVIQTPNATYSIGPQVDKLVCQVAEGPSGPLVELLPSLTGFSMIGEAIVDGIQVQNWNYPINNLSAGAGYSMYLTATNAPIQLLIDGVDFVFDSHPDVYIMDYGLYLPGYTDDTVFEVPPLCASAQSVPLHQLQRGFAVKIFSAIKGEPCEAAKEHETPSSSVETEFRAFLEEYNKEYTCPEEYARRMAIFAKTLEFIETHNNDATQTHKVGLNQFADLSDEEFKTLITPRRGRPANNGAHAVHVPKMKPQDVPDSVDWVSKGAVGAVKDQGVCGSCYAFGSTGSLEGVYQIANGELPSLSEQQIVDCSWSTGAEGNQGCGGGFASSVYQWVIDNGGIASEKSYPYLMQNGWCRQGPGAFESGVKITSYVNVTSGEDNLQEAIASIGPIAVAIDASHPPFRYYRSGVYYQSNCGNSLDDLDHEVLAVGYGTLGDQDYWIVKNSWSTYWGDNGYVWMARNQDNNCGIATQPTYPVL